MFAALTLARFRGAASADGLCDTKSWRSPDDVSPLKLPLARAVEKVCNSMHLVLHKTKERVERELKGLNLDEKEMHLRKTKAAEVSVVRHQADLKDVDITFRAEEVLVEV